MTNSSQQKDASMPKKNQLNTEAITKLLQNQEDKEHHNTFSTRNMSS
jgi:hypothetical protein